MKKRMTRGINVILRETERPFEDLVKLAQTISWNGGGGGVVLIQNYEPRCLRNKKKS